MVTMKLVAPAVAVPMMDWENPARENTVVE
jgi:hypothetical protein